MTTYFTILNATFFFPAQILLLFNLLSLILVVIAIEFGFLTYPEGEFGMFATVIFRMMFGFGLGMLFFWFLFTISSRSLFKKVGDEVEAWLAS